VVAILFAQWFRNNQKEYERKLCLFMLELDKEKKEEKETGRKGGREGGRQGRREERRKQEEREEGWLVYENHPQRNAMV
jgi:hypothetical protein